LAYAKTVNKPIMLDFTGYACVNCRKKNNVWSDAMILPILNNEVCLYLCMLMTNEIYLKRTVYIEQQVLKLKQ
jgi:thiol:disulfide interchange protein